MPARSHRPAESGHRAASGSGVVWLWLAAAVAAIGAAAALAFAYVLSYDCPVNLETDIGCVPVSFYAARIRLGEIVLPLMPVFALFVLTTGGCAFAALRARRRNPLRVGPPS